MIHTLSVSLSLCVSVSLFSLFPLSPPKCPGHAEWEPFHSLEQLRLSTKLEHSLDILDGGRTTEQIFPVHPKPKDRHCSVREGMSLKKDSEPTQRRSWTISRDPLQQARWSGVLLSFGGETQALMSSGVARVRIRQAVATSLVMTALIS